MNAATQGAFVVMNVDDCGAMRGVNTLGSGAALRRRLACSIRAKQARPMGSATRACVPRMDMHGPARASRRIALTSGKRRKGVRALKTRCAATNNPQAEPLRTSVASRCADSSRRSCALRQILQPKRTWPQQQKQSKMKTAIPHALKRFKGTGGC